MKQGHPVLQSQNLMKAIEPILPNEVITRNIAIRHGELFRFITTDYPVDVDDLSRRVLAHFPKNIRVCVPDGEIVTRPLYWLLPSLIGFNLNLPAATIQEDLERYSVARQIHRFWEHPELDLAQPDDIYVHEIIRAAYSQCCYARLRNLNLADAFLMKCGPWQSIVLVGTEATQRFCSLLHGKTSEYCGFLSAIFATFECLQVLDEWHDIDEDSRRDHWNLWTHANRAECLVLIERLSIVAVERLRSLRSSTLRSVLAIQLRDVFLSTSKFLSNEIR